jgi:predicted metal-dependent hydrolase
MLDFFTKIKGPKEALPEFIVLDKLGDAIEVKVRHSLRAKRVFIRIHHSEAELILPNKNLSRAHKFLLTKEAWIRSKLAKQKPTEPIDPNKIPLFGKLYSLEIVNSKSHNVQVKEDVIEVYSSPHNVNKTLIRFFYSILLSEVEPIADHFAKECLVIFKQIKIMNSKSKWGTCYHDGTISFNWRLALAPKEILSYVVVHELCHILEMNHSPRFWALVAKFCPDYKLYKSWLKENGHGLHDYLNTQ